MSYIMAGVAVVGVGTSIYKGIKAGNEKAKNQRELDQLKQPFYKIQNEYNQNRDLAASMAGSGMPDATKNYLTTETQRGLGTGIGATMQAGGNPNDINRLFNTYEDSIDKTAAQDAQMRIGNIQNFMSANKELAGQKTMAWTLNEYRPWENKLKQLTQNIATEKANQNNAINEGLGYVSSYATSQSNSDLMKKLFGNSGTGANAASTALQYAAPTNNVAQSNPVAFEAPNNPTFAPMTDINGNPLQTTPTRPY